MTSWVRDILVFVGILPDSSPTSEDDFFNFWAANKIDLTWKKHRSWSSPYELPSNFGGLSDESADKPLWIPWINWQEVAYLLDDFSLINFCCFVSHRPHFPHKSAASPSRTVWVSGHRHMSCKASNIHGGPSSPGYHKCLPVWQMAAALIKVIRNYTCRIFSSTSEGFIQWHFIQGWQVLITVLFVFSNSWYVCGAVVQTCQKY